MEKNETPLKNKNASLGDKDLEPLSQMVIDKIIHQIVEMYQQGKVKEALEITEQALKQNPDHLTLLNYVSVFAVTIGDFRKAEKYFRIILSINPNDADTHCNLGRILKDQQHFDEAQEHYQAALRIDPNHTGVYNTLGLLLKEQQRFDEAETAYQRAITINPNHAEAYNNLGLLYNEQQRFDEAEKTCQRAISINPNYAEAYNNLGILLRKQMRFDEAEQAYQRALIINPDYADVHNNLGILLKEQKRSDEAEKSYRKALIINPDNANTRWELSLLLLALLRFNEGWQSYEFRYHLNNKYKTKVTIPPIMSIPQYQGESLSGKSLLLWPEQGIGDAVMFASILPELEHAGANIMLACENRLVKLFKRSFPFIRTVAKDPDNRYQDLAPDLDYHLGIGSLPRFYRNQLKDFDQHKPYLKADDALTDKWKQRYQALEHPINIGISWFGGLNEKRLRERSIALKDWLPILSYPANFISLQYGDYQAYLQNFTQQSGIHIYDWEDADPVKDVENFASQIKSLDLVISIDNSTVHFAGALGVETFVMLPFNQDWRWAEEREDSYWYPGVMRLFRQPAYGDWDSVIARVVQALDERFN